MNQRQFFQRRIKPQDKVEWLLCIILLVILLLSFYKLTFPTQRTIPQTRGRIPYIAAEDYHDIWVEGSNRTPCDGISEFHTNESFISDLDAMFSKYAKIYDSENEDGSGLKLPSKMLPDSGYDCEDFAHAIRCLGESYGLNCTPYVFDYYGLVVPDKPLHVGVCCLLDEWVCFD